MAKAYKQNLSNKLNSYTKAFVPVVLLQDAGIYSLRKTLL